MGQKKERKYQIPDIIAYTANKKYNDLLYGVLQQLSYTQTQLDGTKIRYVDKMSYEQMGKKIHVYRTTASKCFQELVGLGLVQYEKDENGKIKRYILTQLPQDVASLVPEETLSTINQNFSRYLVSIYILLVKIYNSKQVNRQSFVVRMARIKSFIGVSITTTSNNEQIVNRLKILNTVGLIKWHYYSPKADQTDIYIDAVYGEMKLDSPEVIEQLSPEEEAKYIRV